MRTGDDWQSSVLRDLRNILADLPWSRDMYLRGSLARGEQDANSDVDLVVTVEEDNFDAALDDLSHLSALRAPGRLPPWLDRLVPDFGGVGFVYLLQLSEQKWGQIDIYLLPHDRRQRMFDQETVLSLCTRAVHKVGEDSTMSSIDITRLRHEQVAARDLQQAVLACYVSSFLLRKRLLRRNRWQIYAETHALTNCVKELVFLGCHADRREWGWRDLPKVAERSPNPELVFNILSIFAGPGVTEKPIELSGRVAGLEKIVALLAPIIWREHGELLRNLGRYIRSTPVE